MSTNYIDQITDTAGTTHDISEGDSTRIFRATCSTAANTAAKVATLDTSNRNFSLTTGVRVAVTFKYGNSATTPTLRVDGSSTGTAKTIAFPTAVATRTTGNGTTYNTWGPYETVIFTYDGTYWVNSGSALGIYNAYNQAAAAGSGTVTSVGITNGGGLSISGSPITTSGSITVGHSNSVTAQTTQAVYPIKIDAQGHISAYGSAVTIPTDTNTTYALSGALSSHKFTSTLTAGGSGSGTSTSDFTLAAGTGITITDDTSNRKMTIACSVTNTDEKLKTDIISTEFSYFPVLTRDTTTAGTKFYDSNFEYISNDGTSTTPYIAGQSTLRLGNSITSGTENRAGWLQLYGNNNKSIILRSGSPTGNRTVTLPDGNGTLALTSDITDTKVSTAAISVNTNYYPVLGTNTTSATTKYYDSSGLRYVYSIDSESNMGLAELILGNGESPDTTGNKKGLITFYSNNDKRVFLRATNDLTANVSIALPSSAGTLALTSQLSNYVAKSGDTMTGALVMTNGLYFMSTHKNESTTRIVCGISTDNTYMFGYGSRASETGSSFFDGHVVNIRSNGLVNITAPDGVTNTGTYNDLVKITSLPVAPGQINASSYKTATTTITAVSGYKPVGIIGYSSSHSSVFPFTYYLTSDTSLYTEFKNVSSSAVTPTFSFKILWLKATGTRTNS